MPGWQEAIDGERAIRESKPQFSVVVTTYNRPKELLRALRSLQSQIFQNWEAIIVDDGSTLSLFAPDTVLNDSRIRFKRIEHTGLPAKAVNAGVALAKADWVGWLADDDEWGPTVIGDHLDYVRRHVNVGATYFRILNTPSRWNGTCDVYRALTQECFAMPFIARRHFFYCNPDQRLLGVEDWELNLRLAKTLKVGYLPNTGMTKHVQDDGLTNILGDEVRAKAAAYMFHLYGEMEAEDKFRSMAYWANKPVKLPFCLRWYRLKQYARMAIPNISRA